jgi:hypothetical protein
MWQLASKGEGAGGRKCSECREWLGQDLDQVQRREWVVGGYVGGQAR